MFLEDKKKHLDIVIYISVLRFTLFLVGGGGRLVNQSLEVFPVNSTIRKFMVMKICFLLRKEKFTSFLPRIPPHVCDSTIIVPKKATQRPKDEKQSWFPFGLQDRSSDLSCFLRYKPITSLTNHLSNAQGDGFRFIGFRETFAALFVLNC